VQIHHNPKKKTKELILFEKENEEKKQIKELSKDLQSKTIVELKEMLKLNQQPSTGIKSDLIARVADGTIRGAIPKCQKCFGGNLTYHKGGLFTCKGFMEDTSFQRCSFKGKDVQRKPWLNKE